MNGQGFDRAGGEHRGEPEGGVGALHHLHHRRADRARQSHAAVLGGRRDALPAALDPGGVRLLEARGRAHDAVLEARAFAIAGAIERRDDVGGEPPGLLESRCEDVARELVEVALRLEAVDGDDLLESEPDIADRRREGHVSSHPAARRAGPLVQWALKRS